MKSLPRFAPAGLLRLAVATTLVLFTTSARIPTNEPKSLSGESMGRLVEAASKDELFHQISEADAKRFLVKMYAGKSLSKEKWKELAEKKNRSAEETAAIFAHFGFSSLEDFGTYAEMLSAFGKKYGVDKLKVSDQKQFFVSVREKEESFIVGNHLLEKVFAKTATLGNMPPECWKCVYDFRDCTNGSDGDWYITYTPVNTYSTQFNLTNGSFSIMQTTYTTPGGATIQYINSSYTPMNCEGNYRNCMASCATP